MQMQMQMQVECTSTSKPVGGVKGLLNSISVMDIDIDVENTSMHFQQL